MTAYYFDSSALVKRYVEEAGSTWIRSLLEPPAECDAVTVALTRVEIASAIARRCRSGSLTSEEASTATNIAEYHLISEFHLVNVASEILSAGIDLSLRHGLRAYDAVHLAAAKLMQSERLASGLSPISLVSADTELNSAALAEGLMVIDPNTHN